MIKGDMLALVLLWMIESNAAIIIRSYSEDMNKEMRDMAKPFQGFYWNLTHSMQG